MKRLPYVALFLFGMVSCKESDDHSRDRFVCDVPEWSSQQCSPSERDVFTRYRTTTNSAERLDAGFAALGILFHLVDPRDPPLKIDCQALACKISQDTWVQLFGQPEQVISSSRSETGLTYDLGQIDAFGSHWYLAAYTYRGFVMRVQLYFTTGY